MSRVRFATQVSLALAAGVMMLVSGPVAVAQQPGPDPLVAPIGVAPAPPADTQSRLKLDITQLTPRVIRADTQSIKVTGQVTNIDSGSRRIDQLEVRLQRGDAITNEGKLREAMSRPPDTDTIRPGFTPVTKSLEPGASAPFELTVPVDSLKLEGPGVYPVLINVNGRPAFGGTERLAGLNVLLPVLRGVNAPAQPSRITVLWPLVDDHPRVLQETVNGQEVLSDDDLAGSLAVGGRLYGMLNAVEITAGANPSLASSICFAVDGDLLSTVNSMSDGYQVRTGDGQTAPGRGKDIAQRWLAKLRQLTRGQCVIALPYADADVTALSRANAADLTKTAAEKGMSTVADILKPVQPQQGVLWPLDSTLDQRALADISGNATVLINPDRLKGLSGQSPYAISQANRAVPIDPLVSSALAGNAAGPVSVQSGLAALVFRTALADSPSRSVLIAPPRRWTAPASEQRLYLETVGQLYTDKLANPQVLPDLVSATATGTASGLDYSQQDAGAELPAQVTGDIAQSNVVMRDLGDAMRPDDTSRKDPADLIEPVRTGLLRAASGSWRGNTNGALAMATNVHDRLNKLRDQVTVSPPGQPITLASASSPIPVRIGNALPVAMQVKFVISESSGFRPADIPERRIAASSTSTVIIPAELLRAGKFTVDVQLATPGGTPLGISSRFELSSTSYGTITVAVTGVAGGVLVLLAGRRIYRRSKKSKSEQQEQSPA
ncbi:DUF6049 family protein [Actinocrispum sp. NPDC049592]|uniref:DUF6049 family protein n=1 Tax=Actinocrispum sp. NPDC049592 TaxID=3154835 RepID=UPI003416C6DE